MRCIRCSMNEATITRGSSGGEVGFCAACFEDIDLSGKCKCCGTTEDLWIHAKWFDKVIEHLCGHCKFTEACI